MTVADHMAGHSPETEALRARFAKFHAKVPFEVAAKVPQYALPVAMEKLSNSLPTAIRGEPISLIWMLGNNGFAAGAPSRRADDVAGFYHALNVAGTPVFVTSDSVLHLYHIQFDETLRDIEERVFYKDVLELTSALHHASIRLASELQGVPRDAALLSAAYFAVAFECLRDDGVAGQIAGARAWFAATKAEKTPADRVRRVELEQLQDIYPEALRLLLALHPAPEDVSLNGLDRRSAIELLDQAARNVVVDTRPPIGEGLAAAEAYGFRDRVMAELALIREHEGLRKSPLFGYEEDYSQYAPRGHYTRSRILKAYFRAFMWLGRMTALIKGGKDALVSTETARIQTITAVLACGLLDNVRLADGRSAREVWERMYAITAFYVGFADDLTPYEYRVAIRKAYGERPEPAALADAEKYKTLQLELARLRRAQIYSGTGDLAGAPSRAASGDELLQALDKAKGFRLMGQRYVPDSHVLGKLVYPTVGPWGGGEFAFTTVSGPAGVARGFPRGLDVMAVLGSSRAEEILKVERDDNYVETAGAKSYVGALADLRREFGALGEKTWNQNLYWCWLSCLKALLPDSGTGYPMFMQTSAWQDKQLNAALGSWSQLRHDTVLYAKPSYTMIIGSSSEMPEMVEGYVEPVPRFYANLLELTRMTRKGLDEFEVLSTGAAKRLDALDEIIERLFEISKKELENQFLDSSDYDFIRNFGYRLDSAVAGVNDDGLQTSTIADVHTDGNTGQVLEEATGNIRPLWVIYPMPDGGLVLGCGPAFSYYEFKQPMGDRLTDEKWRQMLGAGAAPALPGWTSSFGVHESR